MLSPPLASMWENAPAMGVCSGVSPAGLQWTWSQLSVDAGCVAYTILMCKSRCGSQKWKRKRGWWGDCTLVLLCLAVKMRF